MTRIATIRQTRQLDTVSDDDAIAGVRAEQHRRHRWMEMVSVGDDAEVGAF